MTHCSLKPKHRNYWVLPALVICGFGLFHETLSFSAEDAPSEWKDLSFTPEVGFFLRDWNPETHETQRQFERMLPRIQEAPLLSKRLPETWALLIDGRWAKSAGYWSTELKAPDGRPAILLRPQTFLYGEQGLRLSVHELTHLVHHGLRPHEESWVREGIAMISEFTATGTLSAVMQEGFLTPETSLTAALDPHEADYADSKSRGARYGHILQYFYYLYRLCGKISLFEDLLASPSPAKGVAFIDRTLKDRFKRGDFATDPVCEGFETSFKAFQTARFLQDPMTPSGFVTASSGTQAQVRQAPAWIPPYSAMAYRLPPRAKCLAGDFPWGESRCIRIRMK